jgi:hypothetical protein
MDFERHVIESAEATAAGDELLRHMFNPYHRFGHIVDRLDRRYVLSFSIHCDSPLLENPAQVL